MLAPTSISLHLTVRGPDGTDATELDRVTRNLRSELANLELEQLSSVSSSPLPSGAKSGTAFTLGELALVLIPAVAPKLIELLQAWCLRNKDRKVVIKMEQIQIEFPPGGIPADQLQAVLARVVNQAEHAASSTAGSAAASKTRS